jgi:hypothetical protein
MKNLINTAIVILILLISNYALADFQDGLDAYNKQDYTAAFKEWQPLAPLAYITPRLYCAPAYPCSAAFLYQYTACLASFDTPRHHT